MKAYLNDNGLLIKSGKITFKPGQLPKEELVWIPKGHAQFDQAKAWAEGEGLL